MSLALLLISEQDDPNDVWAIYTDNEIPQNGFSNPYSIW